jgi:hypothetical protein
LLRPLLQSVLTANLPRHALWRRCLPIFSESFMIAGLEHVEFNRPGAANYLMHQTSP